MLELNEFQTPLTKELLDGYPQEVVDQLFDYINTVPYISKLISKNRLRAKDLPKDAKGRIIVDLANPHILEDMDYFRQTAIHFQKHGVYTFLRPNANPTSEYGRWISTEINRLWHGMIRPSDGEWIPGYMYYYLNYHPIQQTKMIEGSNHGERVTDFPEIWEGIYWTFHYIDQARFGGLYNNFKGGQHCVEIAKRGASKSYILSALLARNFIVGIDKKQSKKTKGTITAYEKETLEVAADGTLNKFYESINFVADNTEFPRNRLKDSPEKLSWIMGYLDVETNRPKGSLNSVRGVSSKDNPDKSRGKRQNLFLYEEFGKFKKFIDTYQVNFSSVQEGDIAFGQALAVGTGGTEGSDFTGALEMIYNPIGYNVYALPNIFDKGVVGNQKTVFFFGAPVNRKGYYNKDGVSDITGALLSILLQRYNLKYNSTDVNMLTRAKAENPITIQEAIMRRDNNIYPVADITDTLNEIDFNPRALDFIECVKIDLVNGETVFKPDMDLVPAREFPHKDNKVLGCIEIHERPIVDSTGRVPFGRYIAGMDPYDDDASDTLSLGSLFILDLWTDKIVAEYTGRPYYADQFYENSRRLLLAYNAECNYENNKKGVFSHFSRYNSLYLLSENLEFLKEKNPSLRNAYGNKLYGTQATGGFILKYGRSCLRNWLIEPVEISKIEDNKEIFYTVPKLKTIKNRALLKELSLFNLDGNFDRHDAMVMLMLLREDKLRILGAEGVDRVKNRSSKEDDLSQDDFFSKNYDKRFNKDKNSNNIV